MFSDFIYFRILLGSS